MPPMRAALILLLLCTAARAAQVGRFIATEGRVYIKRGNSFRWKRAQKGSSLFEDSVVRTGRRSRAALVLKDGTRVTLGDATVVEVKRFLLGTKRRSIHLFRFMGKLKCTVTPFSGTSEVQVHTQGAVAGVRGTEFLIYHKPPVNVIYDRLDTVEASSPKHGSVVLHQNQFTENTRGGRFITPERLPEGLKPAIEAMSRYTKVNVPVNWVESGRLPMILARWNINYGHYLLDRGRYRDAVEVFRIAHDLTQNASIRSESLLNQGVVLSRFLKDYRGAEQLFRQVLYLYPDTKSAEAALYQLGLLLMQTGRRKEAVKVLNRYLILYPKGRFSENAKAILERAR